jgi:hypothetical protein
MERFFYCYQLDHVDSMPCSALWINVACDSSLQIFHEWVPAACHSSICHGIPNVALLQNVFTAGCTWRLASLLAELHHKMHSTNRLTWPRHQATRVI